MRLLEAKLLSNPITTSSLALALLAFLGAHHVFARSVARSTCGGGETCRRKADQVAWRVVRCDDWDWNFTTSWLLAHEPSRILPLQGNGPALLAAVARPRSRRSGGREG
jgi:hypothetical protein